MESFVETWSPRALAVLRIVTAVLFIQHGTAKLFGIPHMAYFDNLQLFSLMGFAGVLEVVGGLAILLGWFTRPAAFVLSGEMAAAYFMAHAPSGLLPLLNGGEVAALYSWLFLYLAVAGGGAWSLDGLRSSPARGSRHATA
jgi:putative oxidoreductase